MADMAKGHTFVDGDAVTGALLNSLVDSATILPAFVSAKPATAPATADKVLLYDTSGTALIAPTVADVLALQAVDAAEATGSMRTLGFTGNKAAKGTVTARTDAANVFLGNNQVRQLGGTYIGALAIATGAGLGSGGSPAATFDTNSTGLYGRILLTTGSSGGTGTVATITLDKTFANAPFVTIIAYNAGAVTNQATTSRITVGTTNTTSFTIVNTVALPLSTNIAYNYFIFGL